jgi:hypothetical protein
MEHRASAEFADLAAIIRPQQLSKKERLERWATALERRKGTHLRTLRETEYKPRNERSVIREENSALTVAFEDPVLRFAGLKNDTFGEAARFFGLSNWQLHAVVCSCHYGVTMPAEDAAARVRYVASDGKTKAALLMLGAALCSGMVLFWFTV